MMSWCSMQVLLKKPQVPMRALVERNILESFNSQSFLFHFMCLLLKILYAAQKQKKYRKSQERMLWN